MMERMETLECYCKSFDIDRGLADKILQTLKYKWSLYNSLNEQVRQLQKGKGVMLCPLNKQTQQQQIDPG